MHHHNKSIKKKGVGGVMSPFLEIVPTIYLLTPTSDREKMTKGVTINQKFPPEEAVCCGLDVRDHPQRSHSSKGSFLSF